MVALDEMDVAFEDLEDHGSIVRVPEHIAEDINIIMVGNDIVPTLDEVIVHLFDGVVWAIIKANNIFVRKMKICNIVIHSVASFFLSLK